MADLLLALLRVNLAVTAAIAVALALRLPVRRLFGARVAYGLWSLAPLAALAMLAPVRVVTVAVAAAPAQAVDIVTSATSGVSAAARGLDAGPWLVGLWLTGLAASLAHLTWRQAQFGRAARAGRAGPAVIGVLKPRIVTPNDFERRYTPREQQVVLAHEQAHITRQDSRINALVALARCVNWFNPLVHLAARQLRIDQELACDAQVVAAHPTARRAYAEAMLKTQLAARPLPIGCYWPAQDLHPLAERIGLLGRRTPGRGRHMAGAGAVAAIALGGACAAWAARPAELLAVAAPETSDAPAPVSAPAPAPAPATVAAPKPRRTGRHAIAPRPANLVPELAPEGAASPVTGRVLPASATDQQLPPDAFGPPQRVHTLSRWSWVEPGSAVRVLATMTDPDGAPLTTDLTAFGSQSFYRLGYIRRGGSRYKLFTRVAQHGERLVVTAGLNGRLEPMTSGSVTLTSGQTGRITLPSGQVIKVTPTIRPETPEELAAGRGLGGRRYVRVDRVWTP
ncbi:MAG: hypothetical protein E7812_18950 [Phenylobacterium sp.]|nr:MAG: hypothetical protein E7812_18950 [Phenylobacterium sp.]